MNHVSYNVEDDDLRPNYLSWTDTLTHLCPHCHHDDRIIMQKTSHITSNGDIIELPPNCSCSCHPKMPERLLNQVEIHTKDGVFTFNTTKLDSLAITDESEMQHYPWPEFEE